MADHREGNVLIHHEEIPEQHPERHEHTDVSIRGIWITAGSLVAVSLIVFVMLYLGFFALERAQDVEDEANRRSAIVNTAADDGPPASVPRLQGIAGYHSATPAQDTLNLQRENDSILTSYGRSDDGATRIPVERAMELMIEKNLLPTRVAATQPGGNDAR